MSMDDDALDNLAATTFNEDLLKDPAADRGNDFAPTEADLDDEAEHTQALKDAAEAKKTAEATENAKVAGKDPEKKDDPEVKVDDPDAKKADPDAKKDDDKPKGKEPTLPLSRHKQILDTARERAEAAEARLADALKAGTREQVVADTAKDEAQITALEGTYTKQMADGEVKEATATMGQIRALERGVNARIRDQEIAAATERAVETVRFDTTVTSLEAAYPQLDPRGDTYDIELVKEVLEMKAAWEKSGLAPSQALQKAVKYVIRPATPAQVVATEDPDDDADPDADTAATRKAAAVAKSLDASKKQPASIKTVGIDSDKAGGGALDAKAVIKMSQEDFSKLGEAELSKLRGDVA